MQRPEVEGLEGCMAANVFHWKVQLTSLCPLSAQVPIFSKGMGAEALAHLPWPSRKSVNVRGNQESLKFFPRPTCLKQLLT